MKVAQIINRAQPPMEQLCSVHRVKHARHVFRIDPPGLDMMGNPGSRLDMPASGGGVPVEVVGRPRRKFGPCEVVKLLLITANQIAAGRGYTEPIRKFTMDLILIIDQWILY